MSTVSTSGERPPCTHSTAPEELLLPRLPLLEPEAEEPGGPVRVGAAAAADDLSDVSMALGPSVAGLDGSG